MTEILLARKSGPWRFVDGAAKLAFRAGLPGAYGFDEAAHALRVAQASGMAADDVLSLALPASWMVNAKATSRAYRAWLTTGRAAWQDVLGLTQEHAAQTWMDADRDAIARAVTTLAHRENGATLCAVSKVLALLRPHLFPFMDDAALHFVIGTEAPTQADMDSAPATVFLPMMDAFTAAVSANEDALIDLARTHTAHVLDCAQVLDRLIWFDAWGHTHAPNAHVDTDAITLG